jgi:hypothetical protein
VISGKDAVEIDFVQCADRPDVMLRTYISLEKLASEKSFLEFFTDRVAEAVAERFVRESYGAIVARVSVAAEKDLAERVAAKLFPEVIRKIDAEVLTNMVLLQAGRKVRAIAEKEE